MRKLAAAFAALALFAISSSIYSCENKNGSSQQSSTSSASNDSLIKRGAYLVTIMGCDDCHSPKKMGPKGPELDLERRFSGHPASMPLAKIDRSQLSSWVLFHPNLTAFVGPWGVSYAAKITSDPTGIGSWSEAQFIKALREGKFKGMDNTRPLLPPMPWQSFAKASDEDLKAIFSYLKSTKPVSNVVPTAVAPDAIASLK